MAVIYPHLYFDSTSVQNHILSLRSPTAKRMTISCAIIIIIISCNMFVCLFVFVLGFTVQVLKVCRAPGPTAC